jgi:hypothetical protein
MDIKGCNSVFGDRAVFTRARPLIASRTVVVPSALFTKKRAAAPVVEEAPPKKAGLFSFGGNKKAAAKAPEPAPPAKKAGMFSFGGNKKVAPKAAEPAAPGKKAGFFGGGKKAVAPKAAVATPSKADEYKRRQGLGGIIGAFDFAEVRSQSDAELLYDAKYGKLQGGRMTAEQAAALRRKVGGTARDFWKTSVDVVGEYTDKGYVDDTSTAVPALPLLVGVVLALFGTVAYVVSQT